MEKIKVFDYRKEKGTLPELTRQASRAVIIDGHKILMIKLNATSEFKFPGGGVENDESLEDALKRETMEEAGVKINNVRKCLGYIDQVYPDIYHGQSIFYMRSFYYLVSIDRQMLPTNHSSSEQKLGFTPEWVDLDDAIITNRDRCKQGSEYHWTERELYMLEYIKLNLNEIEKESC